MIRVLVDLFLLIGAVFALAGTVGIIRMPDIFTRLQASTCAATLGTFGITVAALIFAFSRGMSGGTIIKILLAGLVVILTNPISNHAMLLGAYKKGDLPETKLECAAYEKEHKTEEVTKA